MTRLGLWLEMHLVLHDWCNKRCSMCNPVCEMVHIKGSLLLTENNSLCSGGGGFPLSLFESSFAICLMLHKH